MCVWPGLSFHHMWANFGVVNIIKLAWENNPTFGDTTSAFSMKWRLRNECRNSVLFQDASPPRFGCFWLVEANFHAARPMTNITQIWLVTHHQCGILHLFLRRHLAGKRVVALRNVGCFPRLYYYLHFINLWFRVINFLFSFHCLITASFHC